MGLGLCCRCRGNPPGCRSSHTHAAQLRAEGVDIGIISKQLGHRSIATTARYLDHIAPQQVIETIRRRTWIVGNTAESDRPRRQRIVK